MTRTPDPPPPISRRSFLFGAASIAALAACSSGGGDARSERSASSAPAASTGTALPSTTAPPPPSPPPPSSAPGLARFVTTGPTNTARMALTFHTDGDLGLAAQLLGILEYASVPMTAFIVGEWLDSNPSWAQRLVGGGHELANHTYTHPSFSRLSRDAMTDEIVRCRDVIARLTGSGGTFFRPSGTADGTSTPPEQVLDVAGAAGYPVVLGFDVDPFDYQDPGEDAVRTRALAALGPGSIVSLHFGHPGTIAALPAVLDGIRERSLTPVTVSNLLALP